MKALLRLPDSTIIIIIAEGKSEGDEEGSYGLISLREIRLEEER